MLKKSTYIVIIALVMMTILSGCTEKGDEKITLQFGHALSEGTAAADLIDEMAENISEQTNGRVALDIFSNSQLGSETEMLEQIQMGSMDVAAIMVGTMQSLDMRMAIEDLPYMWKDIDYARKAYDGEFGDYLASIMDEQGMTKIGYLEWGFRHITNNKQPIVNPEDMRGLKIRVAQSKLRVDTFEEVNALPTAMAFSEVYGALQQGALDAQENPLANIVAPRFDEVQKYLSLTGHFYNTIMMVVNDDTWEQISARDQQIILDEAARISKEVQKRNDEAEESYIDELIDKGMIVNDDVDSHAFREKVLPVYDKWEKYHFGEELMDVYREASGW